MRVDALTLAALALGANAVVASSKGLVQEANWASVSRVFRNAVQLAETLEPVGTGFADDEAVVTRLTASAAEDDEGATLPDYEWGAPSKKGEQTVPRKQRHMLFTHRRQ